MGRYFSNNRLLDKLTKGEYLPVLNRIKQDNDLRIELRIKNQVKVYYKKSLVLTLFPIRKPKLLSVGYWKGVTTPVLELESPGPYFEAAKKLVDIHKRDIKRNVEFEIQQKIARANASLQNKFLILDMEYQFSQEKVKSRTKEKTRFDLVGYYIEKNKILLLELKQGLGSLSGISGVNDHYKRYVEHIEHPQFQSAVLDDVKGILWSKQQLGLIDFDTKELIQQIDEAEIDYAFVFAAQSEDEMQRYKRRFGNVYKTLYLDAQGKHLILKDEL